LKSKTESVDIHSMDEKQVEMLGEQLGKKIGKLGDAAANKMNKITEVYGLRAKIIVQLFNAETGELIKGN